MSTKQKRKYGAIRKGEETAAGTNEEVFDKFFHSAPPLGKLPTPIATPVVTPVATPVDTPADLPVRESQQRPSPQYLDATHTASEQRIYSVMYRETVSKGTTERHFGPKELCERTGIRSDRTIRTALDGLIEKLSIEIVSNVNGDPLGPRYRVYEPREIISRRKDARIVIDPQRKKITGVVTGVVTGGKVYRGTGVKSTGVTGVDFAGVSTKYSKEELLTSDDDEKGAPEGLSDHNRILVEVTQKLTGKPLKPAEREKWAEVARVLVAELEIAAARTTVSSVPSFLAEHLRRRLWKLDKKQAHAEGKELPDETVVDAPPEDVSNCLDCRGSGWWYPEGMDRGVAKCKHSTLQSEKA